MSGSTGYHSAGALMYCNTTFYSGMDNVSRIRLAAGCGIDSQVTVQSNERVNVSWPDGNAPFEIKRL